MTRAEAERHLANVETEYAGGCYTASVTVPTLRKEPFVGLGRSKEDARSVVAMSLMAHEAANPPKPEPGTVTMPRNWAAVSDGMRALGGQVVPEGPPAQLDEAERLEVVRAASPEDAPHRVFRFGVWEACRCERASDHGG